MKETIQLSEVCTSSNSLLLYMRMTDFSTAYIIDIPCDFYVYKIYSEYRWEINCSREKVYRALINLPDKNLINLSIAIELESGTKTSYSWTMGRNDLIGVSDLRFDGKESHTKYFTSFPKFLAEIRREDFKRTKEILDDLTEMREIFGEVYKEVLQWN